MIVVNYNTEELLEQDIKSVISKFSKYSFEIIIVDNNSNDGSAVMIREEFPKIMAKVNNENLGYSKVNNIKIILAKRRYILLLNSDTKVIADCMDKCVIYMDSYRDIGVLGCKVVLPDNRLDHAYKRGFQTSCASLTYGLKLDKLFPKSKLFGEYNLIFLNEDEINEVDACMGAFMMVRREAIDEAGLLDEDFFMYGKDIDWCYRIKNAG